MTLECEEDGIVESGVSDTVTFLLYQGETHATTNATRFDSGAPVVSDPFIAEEEHDQTDLGASDDRPLGPDHWLYRGN